MKKILLASLIGLMSANAAAQEEIKFAMEATLRTIRIHG